MSQNSDNFDWKFYCNYYGDLRSAGINTERKAIDHYNSHGKNESRITNHESARQFVVSSSIMLVDPLELPGPQSFFQSGQQLCNYISHSIKLKRTDKVLEVGCGVGSMAFALSKYLQSPGSYCGLDTDKNCVDWCRSKISSTHHDFDFKHYSDRSQSVPFPFEDNTFDFVFAPVIFTSLSIDDAKCYLEEMSRVLKVGGKCLILCLMWNPCIEMLIKEGRCNIKSTENCGEYRTIFNPIREKAISYLESCVLLWHDNNYLSIKEINYGNWSCTSAEIYYQDYILSEKIKH